MKNVPFFFKTLIVISGIIGVSLNVWHSDRVMETISYFTMQSNLLVVLFFGVLIGLGFKKIYWHSPYRDILKGMITVGILITMLVYHTLLRPSIAAMETDYQTGDMRDMFVHYIVPTLVLLDWVIFDIKGRIQWFYPIIWLILPIYYVFYVLFYTALGGRFMFDDTISKAPYFFMNIADYGFWNVALWSALVIFLYLIIGYILYGLDKIPTLIETQMRKDAP